MNHFILFLSLLISSMIVLLTGGFLNFLAPNESIEQIGYAIALIGALCIMTVMTLSLFKVLKI